MILTQISICKYCFLKLILLKRSNFRRTTETKHAKSGVCSRRINFRKQYFYIDIGVKIGSGAGGVMSVCHPGGNPGANLKLDSHRCYLREVAFEWELTKETIYLPLGYLQGGCCPRQRTGVERRTCNGVEPQC
jgi:hypothetical protein